MLGAVSPMAGRDRWGYGPRVSTSAGIGEACSILAGGLGPLHEKEDARCSLFGKGRSPCARPPWQFGVHCMETLGTGPRTGELDVRQGGTAP